ncbi:MAG TPA: hypothetical protein VF506_17485 [Streptosporangiaceae bacterium]
MEIPDDILERVPRLCPVLPEVTRELVTESYRILAPKKLTEMLD